MAKFIFDELSAVCKKPAKDLKPLAKFVTKLRRDHVTRMYTTNYDDFLLQAAPDLYTGFDPTSNSTAKCFDRQEFWKDIDRDCVFHLHGSVHLAFHAPQAPDADLGALHWYDDRAEASKNSLYAGSDWRRMDGTQTIPTAIVTGLDKLYPLQQQPLSHYYASMARDAMEADIIYVIGCGLGDLHLNTWLGEARRRNPKPPLIFVDWWPDGFAREMDTVMPPKPSRKLIDMIHKLHMPVYDQTYEKYGTGWYINKNKIYASAIWDKGFLGFLEKPNELDHVLKQLP